MTLFATTRIEKQMNFAIFTDVILLCQAMVVCNLRQLSYDNILLIFSIIILRKKCFWLTHCLACCIFIDFRTFFSQYFRAQALRFIRSGSHDTSPVFLNKLFSGVELTQFWDFYQFRCTWLLKRIKFLKKIASVFSRTECARRMKVFSLLKIISCFQQRGRERGREETAKGKRAKENNIIYFCYHTS